MGRRILLTGLDTFWGGRVAAALERDTDVEMLLGMGTGTPSVELERTEYVRADSSYSLLSRIVQATQVVAARPVQGQATIGNDSGPL